MKTDFVAGKTDTIYNVWAPHVYTENILKRSIPNSLFRKKNVVSVTDQNMLVYSQGRVKTSLN
jgi:hypothetical protein